MKSNGNNAFFGGLTDHERAEFAALDEVKISLDKMILSNTARDYCRNFSTIAVDERKRPFVKWKAYEQTKPTETAVAAMFADERAHGIAVIAGKVSGNLEVIDVDCKYDLTGNLWRDFYTRIKEHAPELVKRLVIARTVNNGYHVIYRAANIEGNQKLAARTATADEQSNGDKVKVLIETRGTGGYFVVAPTQGYQFIQHGLTDLPEISVDERDLLIAIARSFDQLQPTPEPPQPEAVKPKSKNELSPFDDYNQRADVPALLRRHGWTQKQTSGDRIHFARPDKPNHACANYHTGLKLFYNFSSSTDVPDEKGLDAVELYARLETGGDKKRAYQDLLTSGYGTPYTRSNGTKPTTTANDVPDSSQDAPDVWETPRPLDLTLKTVEPVTPAMLPEILSKWLEPSARVIGCPFDFLAFAATVSVGALLGARARIKVFPDSDWCVVPNLYGGLVGVSSTKKSPALKESQKPILELTAAASHDFAHKKADYEIEEKFFERQSNEVYKQKGVSLETVKSQINDLTKPTRPTRRRFQTNDTTAASLIQLLNENPNGLLIFRDELMGWLQSLEKDYNSEGRPLFLELWEGGITYDFTRADGRDVQLLSGTCAILGGIQPSKLQRYISEAYSSDNADGFAQRFLYSFPNPSGKRPKPTPEDFARMQSGFTAANARLNLIAEHKFSDNNIAANGDKFHAFKFSSEAQKLFDEWKDDTDTIAEAMQFEDEAVAAFLYKMPKNTAAICLIFHCLENLTDDHIAEETTLRAINYAEVLMTHARRVFALGENKIFALANVLVEKIKRGELKQGFTVREVRRKGWSGFKTNDDVLDVLHVLVDYGYLAERRMSGEGRPTAVYYFHPDLESKKTDAVEMEN